MQIVQKSKFTKGFIGPIICPSLFPAIQFPSLETNPINSMHICDMYSSHNISRIYGYACVYNGKLPFIPYCMSKLIRTLHTLSYLIL